MYLTLAALFLILFGLGILAGVSYLYGYPRYDPGYIYVITPLCTLTGLAPGLLLLYMGLSVRRREKELIEFAGWVKTYRRIGMPDLARKLGKSEFEAEKILVEVVDKGLVRGFLDRHTNEFVLPEAVGQEVFVAVCPRCGGSIERQYLAGETILCPYCESVITPRSQTAPKPD